MKSEPRCRQIIAAKARRKEIADKRGENEIDKKVPFVKETMLDAERSVLLFGWEGAALALFCCFFPLILPHSVFKTT